MVAGQRAAGVGTHALDKRPALFRDLHKIRLDVLA
jgi:hypothetical protein